MLQSIWNKMEYFESIINQIGPKVSLDTFFEAVADCIDEIILKETTEKKVSFLGGETSFSLSDDNEQIIVQAEIYYIDANNRPAKQEFKGRNYLCNLNEMAQERFLDMLDGVENICMEIENPL